MTNVVKGKLMPALHSLSLSQRSNLICGVDFLRLWPFFHLFIIFEVGLPAYLSNHNPFWREHIFVALHSILDVISPADKMSSLITNAVLKI